MSVTSCDLRILMDQPTEPISSHDSPSRHEGRWFAGPERWRLPQGAVRTVAVVVVGVFGQHSPQLPASQDQHRQQLLDQVGYDPQVSILDSFPMPVCRFVRAYRCRRLAGLAAFGRDEGGTQTSPGCWPTRACGCWRRPARPGDRGRACPAG
jgi:hypothetical protein